jgi:hypothetical protein
MRNTVSLFKQYRPAHGLSSAVALTLLLSLSPDSRVRCLTPADVTFSPPGCLTPQGVKGWGKEAPELARLFTPAGAPKGAYEVTVLPGGIEEARRIVRSALAPEAPASPVDGTWQVKQMNPLDVFGDAGVYNKTTLARLYGGLRPSVVRGAIERNGRTVAAVTLVSPYPDGSLSRLEKGTLVIVLRLES